MKLIRQPTISFSIPAILVSISGYLSNRCEPSRVTALSIRNCTPERINNAPVTWVPGQHDDPAAFGEYKIQKLDRSVAAMVVSGLAFTRNKAGRCGKNGGPVLRTQSGCLSWLRPVKEAEKINREIGGCSGKHTGNDFPTKGSQNRASYPAVSCYFEEGKFSQEAAIWCDHGLDHAVGRIQPAGKLIFTRQIQPGG